MTIARVLEGDCLELMPSFGAARFDAVITDPPYGLGFMGKAWDRGVPGAAYWREALRVAKPGAHLVAFGGTRTFHRLTCAIEDAGWEVRDCLIWLYGTGFPKSHNGPWGGTALKPGWEPILLARRPLEGTVAQNVEAYGAGALNIDAARIPGERVTTSRNIALGSSGSGVYGAATVPAVFESHPGGRWPANVVIDEEAGAELEAGASRFFYCAKASRAERNAAGPNGHPTVKPLELMRWLVRLVTPPGGVVLDPFTGSGSTGCAAAAEGFGFVGLELEAESAAVARARLAHAGAEVLG